MDKLTLLISTIMTIVNNFKYVLLHTYYNVTYVISNQNKY